MKHLRQHRPIRLTISGKKTKRVNYALHVATVDVQVHGAVVCEKERITKKSIGHGAKIVLGELSDWTYDRLLYKTRASNRCITFVSKITPLNRYLHHFKESEWNAKRMRLL